MQSDILLYQSIWMNCNFAMILLWNKILPEHNNVVLHDDDDDEYDDNARKPR